jgi:hypothetical protein
MDITRHPLEIKICERIKEIHEYMEKMNIYELSQINDLESIILEIQMSDPDSMDRLASTFEIKRGEISERYVNVIPICERELCKLDHVLEQLPKFIDIMGPDIDIIDSSSSDRSKTKIIMNLQFAAIPIHIENKPWYMYNFKKMDDKTITTLFNIPDSILRTVAYKLLAWPDEIPTTDLMNYFYRPLKLNPDYARENKAQAQIIIRAKLRYICILMDLHNDYPYYYRRGYEICNMYENIKKVNNCHSDNLIKLTFGTVRETVIPYPYDIESLISKLVILLKSFYNIAGSCIISVNHGIISANHDESLGFLDKYTEIDIKRYIFELL